METSPAARYEPGGALSRSLGRLRVERSVVRGTRCRRLAGSMAAWRRCLVGIMIADVSSATSSFQRLGWSYDPTRFVQVSAGLATCAVSVGGGKGRVPANPA